MGRSGPGIFSFFREKFVTQKRRPGTHTSTFHCCLFLFALIAIICLDRVFVEVLVFSWVSVSTVFHNLCTLLLTFSGSVAPAVKFSKIYF